MRIACVAVRMWLPSVEEPGELGGRLGRHAARCLRCRAEVARQGALRRRLGDLPRAVPVPPGFTVVLPAPGEAVERRPARRLVPAAVAAGAVAAGAVVLAGAAAVALTRWRLRTA